MVTAAETPKTFTLPVPGTVITSPHQRGRQYTIGNEIGSGNFGIVYAARDNWGDEVAVKVFRPHGTYEEVRQRAIDEAVKLVTLRHPRITYVHDVFEFQDAFYVVSEKCGQTV